MPTANKTHDLVILRGTTATGFILKDFGNLMRRDRVNDFAPKIAGGAPNHDQQDGWQTFKFDDWSRGFGAEFVRAADSDAMFYSADPGLETSIKGQVVRAAKWVDSDAGVSAVCFCDFGAYTYAGCPTSIRLFDPGAGTWANSKTGIGATVGFEPFNGKLYAALGDSTPAFRLDTAPNTWNALAVNARFFKARGTFLWRALGASLYRSADGAAWSAAIAVGDPTEVVLSMDVFEGRLVVAKASGLWVSDANDAATVFTKLVSAPSYATNFMPLLASQDGWLWYKLLGQTKRLQGTQFPALQDKTPVEVGSEASGIGTPVSATSSPIATYVLSAGGPAGATNRLIKWTGEGWHNVYSDASGSAAVACYYSLVSQRIFIVIGTTTKAQRVVGLKDMPYPDYDTAASPYLYLPHFDATMLDLAKSCRDVVIESELLSSTKYLSVEYQVNKSGTWVVAGLVTSSPQSLLALLPGAALNARDLWLRIGFVTDSVTISPKLRGFFGHYIIRPLALTGPTYEILAEDALPKLDGSGADSATIESILAECRAVADSVAPVIVFPPDGIGFLGVPTEVGWEQSDRIPVTDAAVLEKVRRKQVVRLKLIEAFGGHALGLLHGAFADDASAGAVAWITPENAREIDNLAAGLALASGEASHHLRGMGTFRPLVPAGVGLVGVEVYCLITVVNLASGATLLAYLWNTDGVHSSPYQIAGPRTLPLQGTGTSLTQLLVFGSPSDLWSYGFNPAQVAYMTGIGASVRVQNSTNLSFFNVDALWMAFYWRS